MKKLNTILLSAITFSLCTGMSTPVEETNASAPAHKSHQSGSGYTKPHAGIQLNYKRPKNLQVGENVDIDLGFKVSTQAEQLRVVVNSAEGLQLNSESLYEIDTSKTKKHKISLNVSALQEGRQRIDVSATIVEAGKNQSRSFSIPVIVGDPANFKVGSESDTSTSGYRIDKKHGVVSMPAQESSN